MLVLWLSSVLSALIALGLTAYLRSEHAWLRLLDHPNERSLHQIPTPRTGGLAILAGSLAGWLFYAFFAPLPIGFFWLLAALALVAGISLLDDWRHLGVGPRLLIQALAALCLLPAGMLPLEFGFNGMMLPLWLLLALSLVGVVWMINLYNFMDGMDGLAAGMAVIGFATLAWLGISAAQPAFALFCLSIALGSAGFLYFNWPPARIFMGDVGASSLGLLVAVAILWAHQAQILALWLGMLIFSPFVVDATVTLVVRMVQGKRWWQAHREHGYQRLARCWGHRRTLFLAYLLMFATSLSALCLAQAPAQYWLWVGLMAWLFIYALLAVLIAAVWRHAKDRVST
ncbi:MraY family glycosyltransferase [Thiorhodospira sibirica]|uniref:MraY family glycosyltransferase n=1 Tax=Thiorhodospira sibirica TaxID=154347 RepID=UPI00022C0BB3|nr:glycosyltransferase family 4 protein [Thiorhodospira sibirica]